METHYRGRDRSERGERGERSDRGERGERGDRQKRFRRKKEKKENATTTTAVSPVPQSPTKPALLFNPSRIGGIPFNSNNIMQEKETKSYVIINEHMKFVNNEALFNSLSDSTDFLVVGVIGQQGVGKSLILSQFLDVHHRSTFAVQTDETMMKATHQTQGIQLAFTSDHLILLDTQPILSASILYQMIKSEFQLPSDILTYDNYMELHSYQMALLLFSICHIVYVVDDKLSDFTLWKFVKNIDTLKWGIPDISNPTIPPSLTVNTNQPDIVISSEYYPDVVFISNKMENISVPQLRQTKAALSLFFHNANFLRNTSASKSEIISNRDLTYDGDNAGFDFMHFFIDDDDDDDDGDDDNEMNDEAANTNNSEVNPQNQQMNSWSIHHSTIDHPFIPSHIADSYYSNDKNSDDSSFGDLSLLEPNFFLLPRKNNAHVHPLPLQPFIVFTEEINEVSFEDEIEDLISQTLCFPKRNFATPISEKDWYRNAQIVWDSIRSKTSFISEFNKTLQSAKLY